MNPSPQTSPVPSHTPRYVDGVKKSYYRNLPRSERIDLDEFYQLIGAHRNPSVPGKAKAKRNTRRKKRRSRLLGSRTEFLRQVNALAQKMSPQRIFFLSDPDNCTADHGNLTKPRPGIIAYDLSHYKVLEQEASEKNPQLDWSFIEIAIEFHSSGGSFDDRRQRAHNYAAHLLGDRPDLDSTFSVLVEDRCMIIFICNSSGMKEVYVKESDCSSVLAAIVKYLNEGQFNTCAGDIDRTISASNGPAFTLHTTKGTFKDCDQFLVGDLLGRRTNIFLTNETSGGSPVPVIKEQTMKCRIHWKEKIILNKIHQHGAYPGVVRAKFFDRSSTSAGRSKTRIGLLDKGTKFMEIDTPRKVLYALYDLLEVCRGLFRDRRILHRDISTGNFLWNQMSSVPTEDVAPVPTVFIGHLLDPREPKHKSSITLIDFDRAEIYRSKKRMTETVGTPIFIARALNKGCPLAKPATFPPTPVLRGDAASVYERCYPDRFKLFGNRMETPTAVADKTNLPVFLHELRHDAESSFWVLFWWTVLAAPRGKESVYINHIVWSLISDGSVGNHHHILLSMLDCKDEDFQNDFIHPEYDQLLPLIISMAALIREDYHWVKEEKYRHPEYLHDALQRVILNFVLENKDAPFMDLQKLPESRQVEQVFVAPPSIDVAPVDVRPFSSRGKKRKAVDSSVYVAQLLSGVSSSHESGFGSLMAEDGSVSVISEISRDIDGERMLKKRRLDLSSSL